MTISNNTPRVQITADGTVGPFSFPFRIFQESDLRVFDGGTLEILTTDYTITFDFEDNTAQSGSITYVSGRQPTNGSIITLDRRVSAARTSDIQQSGPPIQSVLNVEFDKIYGKIQEIDDAFLRLVRLSDTTTFTGDVIFPDGGVSEAGKVVGWASNGLALENRELTSLGALSLPLIVSQGGSGSTTASGARTNLGVNYELLNHRSMLVSQVLS